MCIRFLAPYIYIYIYIYIRNVYKVIGIAVVLFAMFAMPEPMS